jgi:hypothetical protein
MVPTWQASNLEPPRTTKDIQLAAQPISTPVPTRVNRSRKQIAKHALSSASHRRVEDLTLRAETRTRPPRTAERTLKNPPATGSSALRLPGLSHMARFGSRIRRLGAVDCLRARAQGRFMHTGVLRGRRARLRAARNAYGRWTCCRPGPAFRIARQSGDSVQFSSRESHLVRADPVGGRRRQTALPLGGRRVADGGVERSCE